RLDVTRDHNHQLGFGTGPHLCAGIQLARFEARLAFDYLLANMGAFEPRYDKLTYSPNLNLRALTELPIRVQGN
ncbi:MAG: cytochrome P450, partial [Pseudomonadota bacterium]